MTHNCSNCLNWQRDHVIPQHGQCRASPPDAAAGWPRTKATNWCALWWQSDEEMGTAPADEDCRE